MSLKVKDIMRVIEKKAPKKLKESYDNVGLMIGDTEAEVKNILVALDCTMDVIHEAVKKNCNFIFTHHPLLFIKPKSINNQTLRGKKILKLIKNDINLYSAHTNFDSVKGGLNDYAAELIGYDRINIMENSQIAGYEDNSGVGRVLTFNDGISLRELCMKVKNVFQMDSLRYSGDENMIIRKAAVINGSGEDFFGLSKAMGVQCIITGDTTYHHVSDITEEGIAVIDGGHFFTEWLPFRKCVDDLKKDFEKVGFENEIIISEKCKNPYKTV